jgi:hypothetical protein
MAAPPVNPAGPDASVVVPRLRSDLVISRQLLHGQTNYVVKDPVRCATTGSGLRNCIWPGCSTGSGRWRR